MPAFKCTHDKIELLDVLVQLDTATRLRVFFFTKPFAPRCHSGISHTVEEEKEEEDKELICLRF